MRIQSGCTISVSYFFFYRYDSRILYFTSILIPSILPVNYLKLVEYPVAVTDLPLGEDLIKRGIENDALISNYLKSIENEKDSKK